MSAQHDPTVLVVEDDPDIQMAVVLILEEVKIRARTANNGQEALDSIEMEKPDLILLDMRMPIMDGWEFAAQFRARYGHSIPVVVLTAAADAKKRAREIAADGVISKPFAIDDILNLLTKFGLPRTSAA